MTPEKGGDVSGFILIGVPGARTVTVPAGTAAGTDKHNG